MADDQDKYSMVKEMLIAFIGGGSLGLIILVAALSVVEWLKK